VKQDGLALELAAEESKADRQIVLAAEQQNPRSIRHAADELLLDSTFAPEVKEWWYILKVSMLSGRTTAVMARDGDKAEEIVRECCKRLQIQRSGTTALLHGTEVLPDEAVVRFDWPGLRPEGEVSEYQLIL